MEIEAAMGMELRSCGLTVDVSLPTSQWHAQVRDICRSLVDGWADLDNEMLLLSEISGGITNLLLKVSKEQDGQAVTVRIFGPNTDAVIDRKRELEALAHLSASDFGAKLIGVFANGMVQSFINARTLDPVDLGKPSIAALIAKEVRRLHGLDIPGSKEPQLWEDIFKFFNKASAVAFDNDSKQHKLDQISFKDLMDEVKTLKEVSDSLEAPVVFSHNDLLSGNIMLDEKNGRLHLIDFEYGCYSYRGFDIGNHFNEYAGFECDYALYPNKEAQYHFFRHYLYPDDSSKASDTELEALYVETNFYALASHLYWAIWAIVQAKYSPIQFDYLDYYFLRIDEYKKRKEKLMGCVASFVSKMCRNSQSQPSASYHRWFPLT